MADLENRLWHADQKILDCQTKLTAANLELARLRAGAETHQQELNYTKRLLEREQRDRQPLEAELHASKELLKAERQARRADAEGPTGDRLMLLKAQLEEATDRLHTLHGENERLRDEATAARRAVDLKGEGATVQLDAQRLKEERYKLALELHEAKTDLAKAKHDANEAQAAMRSVDGLRSTLSESQIALTSARREVERLVGERQAMLEEHGELLEQAKGLADELDHTRHAHSQVAAQKAALMERVDATESTLSALRSELQRREEDFHVDLALFAERDESQRKEIERHSSDHLTSKSRVDELERALEMSRGETAELLQELGRMHEGASSQLALGEKAEEERRLAAMRAEIAEVELRREKAAYVEHSAATDHRQATLAKRLEQTLRELQATVGERDKLAAKLEEALSRCTSSLVAKTLAEDEAKAVQQQLDAYRSKEIA